VVYYVVNTYLILFQTKLTTLFLLVNDWALAGDSNWDDLSKLTISPNKNARPIWSISNWRYKSWSDNIAHDFAYAFGRPQKTTYRGHVLRAMINLHYARVWTTYYLSLIHNWRIADIESERPKLVRFRRNTISNKPRGCNWPCYLPILRTVRFTWVNVNLKKADLYCDKRP